jgi:hypothetical protein
MQPSDSLDRRSATLGPLYSLIRGQRRDGYTCGSEGTLRRCRTVQNRYRQEIEDVVNSIKWTEQDRWILKSWRRALLDMKLRYLFVNRTEDGGARGWCRTNPRDREEIGALLVQLIRSDRDVQKALLEWACRAPCRSGWD